MSYANACIYYDEQLHLLYWIQKIDQCHLTFLIHNLLLIFQMVQGRQIMYIWCLLGNLTSKVYQMTPLRMSLNDCDWE